MRTLSATAIQAITRETTDECFIWLIAISHPDITTIRVTDNTETITSGGNNYYYFPFSFSPPEDKAQNTYTAQFSISNIDPEITTALRSVTGTPTITVSMIIASEPNTILYGPVGFVIDSIDITRKTISANLREKNVFMFASPWPVVTPNAFPGFTR